MPHLELLPGSAAVLAAEQAAEAEVAAAVKRKLLGATAPEAVKTVTQAEGETGITPSATKKALVTVAVVGKAEATAFNVVVDTVVQYEYKGTPLAGDIVHMGTYLVELNKLIKVTKVTGEVSNVKFSVKLMN